MKFKLLLIGTMLVSMLCIAPVCALTGDDFEVLVDENIISDSYTYFNLNDPGEKYTEIFTTGTYWLCSIVTFKPANIPDAPVMVVDTCGHRYIYLPRSVDEWEIKYYSRFYNNAHPTPEYLKNAGVVNLNKFFGKYVSKGLHLELGWGQYICPQYYLVNYFLDPHVTEYYIPAVD